MLEVKSCKSIEFLKIIENAFIRLIDWEEVGDNKLSSWLEAIIDNDNSIRICCEKMNCICER